MEAKTKTYDKVLAKAVIDGLSQKNKSLPSWLFYDKKGDKLFQQIMKMPEYYLTETERSIIEKNRDNFLHDFEGKDHQFDLIELGAGDGTKTEILLKHFYVQNARFRYIPIDISPDVLIDLENRLNKHLPDLIVIPKPKSFYDALDDLDDKSKVKRVLLFMGGNIGNFTLDDATNFIQELSNRLRPEDELFVGFDLKKDPRQIQAAYDDSQGITRAFNLNLLERLNNELEANFNLRGFEHYPYYNPETGEAKSFLVSQKDQVVHFNAIDKKVSFKKWELIYTEISQKYDQAMIEKMASDTGLKIFRQYFDSNQYFCNVIFKK
ncbi:L-histidine N(alpha)-methyltransferase [Marinigracilibium pacificum]|uniref:L-histidine N(Alpha)-methyltransferase n=1 Tax=Marinigracilibium pacificum TaxID=2729599 RepID=A0A848J164_9BACT|nr:L-histidine N(alpha)-methyltransferase [Marinigracilibium pacificum]NMM48224.1 L-histidine N(alpha)-methyltransferase [Marinigracilibium pacificum]